MATRPRPAPGKQQPPRSGLEPQSPPEKKLVEVTFGFKFRSSDDGQRLTRSTFSPSFLAMIKLSVSLFLILILLFLILLVLTGAISIGDVQDWLDLLSRLIEP